MSNDRQIQNSDAFFRILRNKHYENIKYQECIYRTHIWVGCVWDNCDFYRVGYFWGCAFYSCTFRNCTFRGQHTYLGASFRKSRFIDCDFTDVSFGRTSFTDCSISGNLINIVFYGKEAPKDWRTKFKNVDLSHAKLIDTDFRCGLYKEEIIT